MPFLRDFGLPELLIILVILVLLFGPGRGESRMFFTNIFSWASRRRVCELAYASTRWHLRRRRDDLEPILARHGLRIRTAVLEDDTRTVWGVSGAGEQDTATTAKLRRALAALDDSR